MVQGLSLSEISHVIALATAPAFLLGGIVAFLALLLARMNGLVDRMRLIDDIDDADERRARHKSGYAREFRANSIGLGRQDHSIRPEVLILINRTHKSVEIR